MTTISALDLNIFTYGNASVNGATPSIDTQIGYSRPILADRAADDATIDVHGRAIARSADRQCRDSVQHRFCAISSFLIFLLMVWLARGIDPRPLFQAIPPQPQDVAKLRSPAKDKNPHAIQHEITLAKTAQCPSSQHCPIRAAQRQASTSTRALSDDTRQ
jgi:hypothetical protein